MKQGFVMVLLSLLLAFGSGCGQETPGSGKLPEETGTVTVTPKPTEAQETTVTPEPQETIVTPEPTGTQETTVIPEPTAAQEEIRSGKPLEKGTHFVAFNPKSILEEYFYGDVTVYDCNWEKTAEFTDVMLHQQIFGIYSSRYLPVGRLQQTEAGELTVCYGIYDLEQNAYSVEPSYGSLEILDAACGYFVVPIEADDWVNCKVINGKGETLLENVQMMDWITITKFGNGYLEMYYDSVTWENGCSYRFYDESLKLKHVYCETMAAMPDDEDMEEGVDYTLMEDTGCLVNADGELVLNWAIFLDKFGDGRDMDCQMRFPSVTLASENEFYPVLYQNKVYLLDENLTLFQLIENPVLVKAFENADFGLNFCYYLDEQAGDWVYGAYENETLLMCDGMTPDYIEKSWGENAYLMARRYEDTLFIDEHTADGGLVRFQIKLREDMQNLQLSYSKPGYVIVSQDCGETIPNPYFTEEEFVTVYEKTVYYRGNEVYAGKGISFDYMYALDETTAFFHMSNGKKITIENEYAQEEHETIYLLADFCLFRGDDVVYEAEDIYLLADCNGVLFFLKGEYMYAVGYDGTEYLCVLHNCK